MLKMSVTQEIFEAFLKCPRKSHLVSEGTIGAQSEFYEGQRRLQKSYEQAASARLRSSLQPNDWNIGTHPAERLQERRYRLVFDYVIEEPDLRARLHALEADSSRACARDHSYIPIRFTPKEKVTASDKLVLAFDAFVFSRAMGELPAVGKIVHGRLLTVVKLSLPKFLPVSARGWVASPGHARSALAAFCYDQTRLRELQIGTAKRARGHQWTDSWIVSNRKLSRDGQETVGLCKRRAWGTAGEQLEEIAR